MTIPARQSARAFSLTEVTLSVGIIATVILPLIAMLAGSSNTVVQSQDRFAAVQLARSIEGQFRYSSDKDAFVVQGESGQQGGAQQGTVAHPTLLNPPGSGGSSSAFLGYDRAARFVREIDRGEFESGLDPSEEEIFYLAKVGIETSDDGFSTSLDAPDLYRITITVGQPAFTEEKNRTREILTTLVSANR